ncbi:caspase domain-containing protein [Streptomyces sp. Da 82-17]|uniref:caspase family protein n=1 Tax=Streptomyces sp. Da 82-17 TaxID=3377116 RepID=UPI0038D3F5E2
MTDIWFPRGAHSRVVCIGVDAYQDPELPPLRSVRRNLADLRNALTNAEHGLFTQQEAAERCAVLGLDGPPINKAAIGQTLSKAAEEATDLLLVYYSGHGVLDHRGQLHLALPDTDSEHPEWAALPLTLIKETLTHAKARARILVLDCCFSGRAIDAMAAPAGQIIGQLPPSGTYTLTSTNATSLSYAPSESRNSVFTEALLGALSAPQPLTMDGIYRHVRDELRNRKLPGPRCRATGDAPHLALARGPIPAPPPDDSPPHPPRHPGPHERQRTPRLGRRARWAIALGLIAAAATTIGVVLDNKGGNGEEGSDVGGTAGSEASPGVTYVLSTVTDQWTHHTPDAREDTHAGTLIKGSHYFYCKEKGETFQAHGRNTSLWLRTDDDEGNKNVYISATTLDASSYATFRDKLPDCTSL